MTKKSKQRGFTMKDVLILLAFIVGIVAFSSWAIHKDDDKRVLFGMEVVQASGAKILVKHRVDRLARHAEFVTIKGVPPSDVMLEGELFSLQLESDGSVKMCKDHPGKCLDLDLQKDGTIFRILENEPTNAERRRRADMLVTNFFKSLILG